MIVHYEFPISEMGASLLTAPKICFFKLLKKPLFAINQKVHNLNQKIQLGD